MSKVPPFEQDGLLPPGDYEVSFDQLRSSVLVAGPGNPQMYPSWDAPWRRRLVDNLELLTHQLWKVGVRDVFADGSFARTRIIQTTLMDTLCAILIGSGLES